MKLPSVLIVEDEAIIATDLTMIMQSIDFQVVGTADNANEAIELISNRNPDLILIDVNIKGNKDGIELAGMINERFKKPFIFITSHTDKATLDRAKHTFPYGYIVKPFNEHELKATIEMAMFRYSNENFNSLPAFEIINKKIFSPLTDKEYDILEDMFLGLANQQIASKKYISINTVKTHIKNIYVKIEIHNRAELIKWLASF